jgi:membrane protein required for beta-lactamase induction
MIASILFCTFLSALVVLAHARFCAFSRRRERWAAPYSRIHQRDRLGHRALCGILLFTIWTICLALLSLLTHR